MQRKIFMFYDYVSTVYHMVYYLTILLLKTILWKPCIRGCLVNTSDEIFYKQLRAQVINAHFAWTSWAMDSLFL